MGVSVVECTYLLLSKTDCSLEKVINWNFNDPWWLTQELSSRKNVLDLAWRFEPATPRMWCEHFTTTLTSRHYIELNKNETYSWWRWCMAYILIYAKN